MVGAAALPAAILIPLAALVVYPRFGNPGAIESASAFERLEGPLTAERLPAFRNQLARHVADHPADGRAWALLGRLDLALEHYGDAATAFERAIRASRKVAGDPEIWVDYAEAVGMAEGRTLRGRPDALVGKALELDPANPRALETAGSVAMEKGARRGRAPLAAGPRPPRPGRSAPGRSRPRRRPHRRPRRPRGHDGALIRVQNAPVDPPGEWRMNDKTVKDAFMEVVVNQLETEDPPETKATLERVMAGGHSNSEAMQLIAAVARNEMQAMLSMGRAFDNARYAKLLAKLPQLD